MGPINRTQQMKMQPPKQKIVMVTGKGGVGKSVLAASLALKMSQEGLKTLLVELGGPSFYQAAYKKRNLQIGYKPVEIQKNLDVALWAGEAALKEYVAYLIKIEKLVDLFFENKVMKTFIRAAPALKELAILGKMTSGIRQWGPPLLYDRIVVDGFATGHFLALLKAPIGMAELIPVGPMGEHSRNMQKVLSQPASTQFYIVSTPEELPVSESIELYTEIKKWLGQEAHFILNKKIDCSIGHEIQTQEALRNEFKNSPLIQDILRLHQNSITSENSLRQASHRNVMASPLIPEVDTWSIIERLAETALFGELSL